MDNWSERSVDTLPVTKYTLLAHFFNFELFIFENEIKIGVCLLLSSEGAPKKLKATTITKLKKLKIGFLTTLSSECIWQQFFFTNFFLILIAYENANFFKAFLFSRFFWIFSAYEIVIFLVFCFHEFFWNSCPNHLFSFR